MEQHFDVAIAVPLQEEFKVLIETFPLVGNSFLVDGLVHFELASPVPGMRIVARPIGDMGNEASMTAVARMCQHFSPELGVLIGLGGAMDDSIRLGDVVVANPVVDYLAAAKVVDGQPHAGPDSRTGVDEGSASSAAGWPSGVLDIRLLLAPRSYALNRQVLDRVTNFDLAPESVAAHREWVAMTAQHLDAAGLPPSWRKLCGATGATMHVGAMASGPFVGASPVFKRWLLRHNRKFLAIEMEAAGAARAAYELPSPIPMLVLRGVSDAADSAKKKLDKVKAAKSGDEGAFRRLAMLNSATLLEALLPHLAIDCAWLSDVARARQQAPPHVTALVRKLQDQLARYVNEPAINSRYLLAAGPTLLTELRPLGMGGLLSAEEAAFLYNSAVQHDHDVVWWRAAAAGTEESARALATIALSGQRRSGQRARHELELFEPDVRERALAGADAARAAGVSAGPDEGRVPGALSADLTRTRAQFWSSDREDMASFTLLPGVDLLRNFRAVLDGARTPGSPALTEDDLAFLLMGSVWHNADVEFWINSAGASPSAARCLAFLTISVGRRPAFRAAVELARYPEKIRELGLEGVKREPKGPSEIALHEAIRRGTVGAYIRDSNDERLRGMREEILDGVRDRLKTTGGFPGDGPSLPVLKRELREALDRFALGPRAGGGHDYFLTPAFARVAREAKSRFRELSDEECSFLLQGALYAGMGEGFGIFDFLPGESDAWALPVLGEYLRGDDYRQPRYRSALILQYLVGSSRDEVVIASCAATRLRTAEALRSAIFDRTVRFFLEDVNLCYDLTALEGEKRRALISTAVKLRQIYTS